TRRRPHRPYTHSLPDARPILARDPDVGQRALRVFALADIADKSLYRPRGNPVAVLAHQATSKEMLELDEPARCRHVLPAGERGRSEEHTSELQSRENLVCRLL